VIIGGWRGHGWRVLDADPRLGSRVRDWIRSAISSHDCPVDPEDAALVVSELHANALIHGPARGRVLVGYCLWRDGARLVVCDGGGTAMPQLVHGGRLAEGCRGLHIVDSLAARWGSFRLPDAQVVWSDFGKRLRAPDSDAWAWLRLVLSGCPLSEPAPPLAAQPCTVAASCGRGAGPGAVIAADLPGVDHEPGGVPQGGRAAAGTRAGPVAAARTPAWVR
jgi:anti-sigma regulatory factor (Ser/Thr protein kinase)